MKTHFPTMVRVNIGKMPQEAQELVENDNKSLLVEGKAENVGLADYYLKVLCRYCGEEGAYPIPVRLQDTSPEIARFHCPCGAYVTFEKSLSEIIQEATHAV